MPRALKWTLIGLAALAVLLGVAVAAVQSWLGSDDFRARVERQGSDALGVPLRLQAIKVALWPLPGVSLRGVEVTVKPPISAARVDVRPQWLDLLGGTPRIASLRVTDAVLSQAGLDALQAAGKAKSKGQAQQSPSGGDELLPLWLPHTTVFDSLSWTNAKGASWTLDAKSEMGPDGLPEEVSASVLKGSMKDARLKLQRTSTSGLPDTEGWPAWELDLRLAGGSVKGKIAAKLPGTAGAKPATDAGAPFALRGQLETRDVDVAALTAPARTVSGRLEASTRLLGRGATLAALGGTLETQTKFNVKNAVVHGIDLAQAVKSVGMNKGGQTALDTLAGQVHTQGASIQLSNLVASSGVLSATGNVNISSARALSGRVNVDMAPGVVGVPLQVGGTVDSPSVMLTRGAMIGAAVGTVLAPGVGTGAGASLGDKMGEGLKGLFGGKK